MASSVENEQNTMRDYGIVRSGEIVGLLNYVRTFFSARARRVSLNIESAWRRGV
jgi:hypothetical protein